MVEYLSSDSGCCSLMYYKNRPFNNGQWRPTRSFSNCSGETILIFFYSGVGSERFHRSIEYKRCRMEDIEKIRLKFTEGKASGEELGILEQWLASHPEEKKALFYEKDIVDTYAFFSN